MLLDEWRQALAVNMTDRAGSISSPVAVGAVKLVGSVLAMCVFVVLIELALKWNHITGVYSCDNFSQVFVLVVGGSVFIRILMTLAKRLVVRDIELAIRW